MVETWRDIKGYEDLYQASNLSRIKSLNYNHSGKERILKTFKNKDGYLQVGLWKNNKRKNFLVHRLVAQAFLDNPNNYKEVNHKDENKLNNNAENLEWCDRKYNNNYGTAIERRSKKQLNDIKKSKPVLQYDLEGNFIKEWLSAAECGRNGYNQGHVSDCCRGVRKTHKGFIWRY